ncbi:M16 family metallopeptidase [Candidatus Sumerlaeota bacterium]
MLHKRTLPNGVRLVSERIPGVRSVALGLWLEVGSRQESPRQGGLAHLIEHMFFKGTERRDVLEIATEINNLGGHANAFTSQENICLHIKVVDNQLERALDLLADLLCHSRFADAELDRERNVIAEEIRMYEDTPDEQVIDNFTGALWHGSPLGQPILGPPRNIQRFRARDIREFCAQHFSPQRLVVAVAGNFDRRRLNRLVDKHFAEFAFARGRRRTQKPVASFRRKEVSRELEQAHICLGAESPSRKAADRYAYGLMNLMLGGGMNSRIFQEVREKRGLAYAIGSMHRPYMDTGYFAISGGTHPSRLTEMVEICLREVRRIYEDKVGDDELQSAKEHFRGSILLGLESTSARMSLLADQEMTSGKFTPIDEVLRRIDAVSVRDVQRVARKYLRGQPVAIAVIGPERLKLAGKTSLRF